MFEHLIIYDDPPSTIPLEKATPQQVLDAQVKTADFLESIGAASDEEVEEKQTRRTLN